MIREPKTFFRYRAFSATTLESLCHDTLHFAHPGSFNDPLDCNPSVECDSSVVELRSILQELVRRRVKAEVMASLKNARVKGDGASAHAEKRAQSEAQRELEQISYNATDPDYSVSREVAEASLLTNAIERELLRHYDRGVCCFSSTYASPLLWSHYGDQHKGLCIGYGLERIPAPKMERIRYQGGRAVTTSSLLKSFVDGEIVASRQLDCDVLLRKARGWRYEKEWRLIGAPGVQDSPLLLKEVAFGLRCSPSVKHAVVKALEGRSKPVRFFEVYEVKGSYTLRRSPLDIGLLQAGFPITATSGEELFGSDLVD